MPFDAVRRRSTSFIMAGAVQARTIRIGGSTKSGRQTSGLGAGVFLLRYWEELKLSRGHPQLKVSEDQISAEK
jgi:hypothetical protein